MSSNIDVILLAAVGGVMMLAALLQLAV